MEAAQGDERVARLAFIQTLQTELSDLVDRRDAQRAAGAGLRPSNGQAAQSSTQPQETVQNALLASMQKSQVHGRILECMAELAKKIVARFSKERDAEMEKARMQNEQALQVLKNSESTPEQKELAIEQIEFLGRLMPAIADYYAKAAALDNIFTEVRWRTISGLQRAAAEAGQPPKQCVGGSETVMTHEDYLSSRARYEKILDDLQASDLLKQDTILSWYWTEKRWEGQQRKNAANEVKANNAATEKTETPVLTQVASQKAEYMKKQHTLALYIGCYFFTEEVRVKAALDFYQIEKEIRRLVHPSTQSASH